MVFYNICHHIFYVDAGGTHLLRDKAGGCHARSGIDFEHINLIAFGYYIVYTHNAFAS